MEEIETYHEEEFYNLPITRTCARGHFCVQKFDRNKTDKCCIHVFLQCSYQSRLMLNELSFIHTDWWSWWLHWHLIHHCLITVLIAPTPFLSLHYLSLPLGVRLVFLLLAGHQLLLIDCSLSWGLDPWIAAGDRGAFQRQQHNRNDSEETPTGRFHDL